VLRHLSAVARSRYRQHAFVTLNPLLTGAQGPEECYDKVKTIVQDKPAEECSIQPHRQCQHVTKLVPTLGKGANRVLVESERESSD
jgi:hypothetical protein